MTGKTTPMLKRLIISFAVILSLALSSCSVATGGLQSYVDARKGYEFLYPNGWLPVDVKNATAGVDIVYRDLIERSENLSVIISEVPADKNLADIGSATDVGYRFLRQTNDNPDSKLEADLITADTREVGDKQYYILEYAVENADGSKRHNLASVAVSRGKLFTFNITTNEARWEKVADTFTASAKSFTVY